MSGNVEEKLKELRQILNCGQQIQPSDRKYEYHTPQYCIYLEGELLATTGSKDEAEQYKINYINNYIITQLCGEVDWWRFTSYIEGAIVEYRKGKYLYKKDYAWEEIALITRKLPHLEVVVK